jgi:hypothetical protein
MADGRADADVYTETAARIMALYRQRIDGTTESPEAKEISRGAQRIERQLRLAGVRAERDEIFRLGRERDLDEEAARRIIRELDLLETRYARDGDHRLVATAERRQHPQRLGPRSTRSGGEARKARPQPAAAGRRR